jgi:putative membrane protein
MTINVRQAAFVLLVSLVGCAPDTEEPAGDGAAEIAAPAPSETAAAAPAVTDPQIAHIAVTANTIDIEAGRVAEAKATRSEVRDFAQTMITDHTAVNEQAGALAQRLGVVPEDNDVSRSLQAGAAEAAAQLEGLSGAAFDSAYIEREVEYHQAVLDALDQTLIPSATNAELRTLLEQVRPAIAAHLEHARSLRSSTTASR